MVPEDYRKVLCFNKNESLQEVDDLENELFGEDDSDSNKNTDFIDYDVDSAYQGQEALAMIQKAEEEGRPYALAFMDVRMPPGWDGLETIERLWKEDSEVQVVICTAYSEVMV